MAHVEIDRRLVLHIAALARLEVAEDTLDRLTAQMKDILNYVERLDELDLAGVEPTSHAGDLAREPREDRVNACLAADDLFANAPDPEPPFVRVPKIVEGGGNT